MITDKTIIKAAKIIKQGGIVAFPTETVYGLGADALNADAVKRIFEVKERPFDNPLIVHIASFDDLYKLVKNVSELERKIAEYFWPGPLTIIFKKKNIVPDIVTANLNSVAVRFPADVILQKLIKYSNCVISAPSANKFMQVSPTSYKDVIADFGSEIDFIIKGRVSSIGIESTVIRVKDEKVEILRPGPVTKEQIENQFKVTVRLKNNKEKNKLSPGLYKKHYSPSTKVKIIYNDDDLKFYICKGFNAGYITIYDKNLNLTKFNKIEYVNIDNNYKEYAFNLYALLRKFDSYNLDIILVDAVPKTGLGLAIMDRLEKAASE